MQSDGDDRVSTLLEGLKKVDAPEGFESGVMRRITERRSESDERRPILLLGLKFAIPMALLMLIGGALVVFNGGGSQTASVPPVNEESADLTVAQTPAEETAVMPEVSGQERTARPPATVNRKTNLGNTSQRPDIRSEDFAVEGPGETFTPPGIHPGPKSPVASNRGGVPVSEVLGMIGAVSSCGTDGCKVTSVSRGGLAERAKLAAGDLIVSIDGRKVDAATVFGGATSFKSFQVVRDGRTLTLSLLAK